MHCKRPSLLSTVKHLQIIYLAVLFAGVLFSRNIAGAEHKKATISKADEIIRVEKAWDAANAHHNGTALRRFLEPEFVQIGEDGSAISRDQAIAKLMASKNETKAYRIEKRSIQIEK